MAADSKRPRARRSATQSDSRAHRAASRRRKPSAASDGAGKQVPASQDQYQDHEPAADGHPAGLAPYEAEQVRQIAAWKAEPPPERTGLLSLLAHPLARVAEYVVPGALATATVKTAYEASELTAGQQDIQRPAGVEDLGELRHKTLQECDRLAESVSLWSQGLAAGEGAATGVGGFLTAALDLPLLLGQSVRAILRVGHCYGEPLDRPEDRALVMGILMVAASGDPAKKQAIAARPGQVSGWLLVRAEEMFVTDEPMEFLLKQYVFNSIPGLGAITGGLQNYAFLGRVNLTARYVFQERWLRDNGKVETIAPAAPRARDWRQAGLVSRSVYSGFYYLGYGVSLPVWLVASVLPTPVLDNPLTRGLRDGAAAAVGGAEWTMGRLTFDKRPEPALSQEPPALAPA